MWRCVDFVIVLALIGLYLFCENVTSDELNEDEYLTYEYKQIFSGIPSFTEYLFNAVEEHPEILEKSDITMFKKNTEKGGEIVRYNKRSLKSISAEKGVLDEEEYEEENCVNNFEESETNKAKVTYKFKDINTEAYKYDDIMLMFSLREDVCENKSEIEVRHYKSEDLLKDNQAKRKEMCNEDNGFDETNNFDWKADAYPGFKDFFRLGVTPEEIEKSHIMVERLLEEYNMNNN